MLKQPIRACKHNSRDIGTRPFLSPSPLFFLPEFIDHKRNADYLAENDPPVNIKTTLARLVNPLPGCAVSMPVIQFAAR